MEKVEGILRATTKLLPLILRHVDMHEDAERCERATDLRSAGEAAGRASERAYQIMRDPDIAHSCSTAVARDVARECARVAFGFYEQNEADWVLHVATRGGDMGCGLTVQQLRSSMAELRPDNGVAL